MTAKRIIQAAALAVLLSATQAEPACKPTSPTAQNCEVILTWTDNANVAGNNQEDFTDIYYSLGQAGQISKVGQVLQDVTTFTHIAVGVGPQVALCYRVQAGNQSGLSAFSNTACYTTPVIIFLLPPSQPTNLVTK